MNLDALEKLKGTELEQVQRICQDLFHKNFINEYTFSPMDGMQKVNEDYTFVQAHFDAVSLVLELSGWHLNSDDKLGVLYLTSDHPSAKVTLTKMETLFLLAIRLIYENRRSEANAAGWVSIYTREISEQLTTLGTLPQPPSKADREKALRTLAGKNLLFRATGRWGEPDSRLVLMPSILCAVDREKLMAVMRGFASPAGESQGSAGGAEGAENADALEGTGAEEEYVDGSGEEEEDES